MLNNPLNLEELKRRMDGALKVLQTNLVSLRTGRASINMLDSIIVDAYGQSMPINQVGTVSIPESRTISVQVWDKSTVGAVEKAIRDSDLGLNPVVDGSNLRISLPELNEERRRELVKIAHKYAEESKVSIRHVRRDGMEIIKKIEKDGTIGKDEAFSQGEVIQKLTDSKIVEVDNMLASKETEIMRI